MHQTHSNNDTKKKVKTIRRKKVLTKNIIVANVAEFTKEAAQGLADRSGNSVVLVHDMNNIKMLEPEIKTGFALYKALKDAGYHQGGVGNFIQSPDTNEKVYIPHPSEIYNSFVTGPEGWQTLTDAMVRVWIELNGKKTN